MGIQNVCLCRTEWNDVWLLFVCRERIKNVCSEVNVVLRLPKWIPRHQSFQLCFDKWFCTFVAFSWIEISWYSHNSYCVKSVQIRSYFWSVFSCIQTKYGEIWSTPYIQSKYRKKRTRNNSVFGHFSRSELLSGLIKLPAASKMWKKKKKKIEERGSWN